MTAKGRDSGVDVVHGCFPEGGDSTLNIFSWEPLPVKLQTTNEFLWLANWQSHKIIQDVHVHVSAADCENFTKIRVK